MDSMMNLYLTESEKALALQEAEENITFRKLFTMYEMVNSTLAVQREQAELKVFKESGTYDDLAYYYEEAEKEADEKKKGIISSIINAITDILNSIGEAVSKLFKKGNPNDEVQIPESAIKDHDNILAFWNNISKGFAMIKSGNVGEGLVTFAKGLIVPTLALAAAAGTVKLVKMQRSKANNLATDVDGVRKQINNGIKTITDMIGDGVNVFLGKVKDFVASIRKWVNNLTNKISGVGEDDVVDDGEPETLDQDRGESIRKWANELKGTPHGEYHKKGKIFFWHTKDGEFKKAGGASWMKKNDEGKWETLDASFKPEGFSRNACVIKEASELAPICGKLYVEKMREVADFYYGEYIEG